MIILDILFTLIFWLATLLYATILFIPFLIIVSINKAWGQIVAIGWGKIGISSVFLPHKITGIENIPDFPVLIATNHSSSLDIFILLGYLPKKFKFLMKEELFKVPLYGTIAKLLGFYSINRSNSNESYRTIQIIIENLKKNQDSILIFPEGTRNKGKGLLPFKRGLVRIAAETQLPILPVTINGAQTVLPKTFTLLKRAPISLSIGKIINPPKPNDRGELDRVNQELWDAINSMLVK